MRFTVLHYGTMELPKNMILGEGATSDLFPIPIWGILMQTEGHNVIYDLGCMHECMEKYWSESQKKRDPYQENETVQEMLAKVGLTTDDIDTIIVSHLHSDHFGLITEFPNADVYVPEEEWVVAMKKAFGSSDMRSNPTGPYYFRCMSAPVKKYHFVKIGDDFDLYEGLKVITLPGHTPNLLSILVTTDSGEKRLFCSDAVYTPINVGPPVQLPGVINNPDAYRASLEKAIQIADEEGAQMMYSHWYPFFDTLKKCPEWYE
jgi:N-acyl homoserine lactone hydrolase